MLSSILISHPLLKNVFVGLRKEGVAQVLLGREKALLVWRQLRTECSLKLKDRCGTEYKSDLSISV